MNKATLVSEVSKRTGMRKSEVSRVVEATLRTVRDTVSKGERVTLAGFGTFEKRRRSARLGRNPRTGKEVKIPPRTTPSFKPGNTFREAVVPKKRKRKRAPARRTRR